MKLFRASFAAGIAGAILVAFGADAGAYVIHGASPGKWGSPVLGTGARISWSVMGSGLGTDHGLTVDPAGILPTGYVGEIASAFSAWSAVADLTFVQTLDPGTDWLEAAAYATDIRIGFRPFDGPYGNLGYAYFPEAGNGAGAGDIFLDSSDWWTPGGGTGFSLVRVLIHEIGHAIGLEHALYGTTMSPYYSAAWQSPQADDIAGAQYLYGAPAAVAAPPSAVPAPPALLLLFGALALLGAIGRRGGGDRVPRSRAVPAPG